MGYGPSAVDEIPTMGYAQTVTLTPVEEGSLDFRIPTNLAHFRTPPNKAEFRTPMALDGMKTPQ